MIELSLIPEETNVLSLFRPKKLVTDEALRAVYDAFVQEFYPSELPLAKEGIAKLKRESGFDPEVFSEVVVCGDVLRREYWGGIAEGEFTEENLVAELEKARNEKFDLKEYQGHRIYADKRDEFWICFLDAGKLALGFKQMVAGILEVKAGAAQRIAADICRSFVSADNELVKMTIEIPERMRTWIDRKTERLSEFSLQLPLDMSQIEVSLATGVSSLRVRVQARYASEERAQEVVELLEGIRKIAIGMIKIPEITQLLKRVETGRSDSSAGWSLETPKQELIQAIKEAKELLGKIFK